MSKTLEIIDHLRRAKSCILPSDYAEDDVRRKEEWHSGYNTALEHVESELSLGYMVLGFRNFPCSPSDYGMSDERDNPMIFHSRATAEKFAQKVTLDGMKEYGKGFKAKVVHLADPEEVYFKG